MPTPTIHGTAKVTALMRTKTALVPADADPWCANLFAYQGRKCLLITHAATCWSMVALDVRKADLQPFDAFFTHRLRTQLLHEWPMHTQAIEHYLATLSTPILSTTNNDKATLGVMNLYVQTLKYKLAMAEGPLTDALARNVAWGGNDGLVSSRTLRKGPRDAKYFVPAERMCAVLGIAYDRKDYSDRQSMALWGRKSWRSM